MDFAYRWCPEVVKNGIISRTTWRYNIELLDHSDFINQRIISPACMYCNQRRDIFEAEWDFLNTFNFCTTPKNGLELCNSFLLTSFDINCDVIPFSTCILEDRSGHSDSKIVSLLRANIFQMINPINVPYNKIWLLSWDISLPLSTAGRINSA